MIPYYWPKTRKNTAFVIRASAESGRRSEDPDIEPRIPAVPFLRKLNEGFRTPGLIIPILGTAISLALFLTLSAFNFLAAGIAIAVGALIYAVSRSGADVAPSR